MRLWHFILALLVFTTVLGSRAWALPAAPGIAPFRGAGVDRAIDENPDVAREDILAISANPVFDREPMFQPAILDVTQRLHREAMALASVQSSA